YAALGLIHDLNPSAAGGAEIIDVDAAQADQGTSTTASLPAGMSSPPITENQSVGPCDSTETTSAPPPQGNAIPKGHGRIIRDQTGNILRIELPEEEQSSTQPAEDVEMDMEQLESGLEGSVKETWIKGMGMQTGRAKAVALREDVVDGEYLQYFIYSSFHPTFSAAVRSGSILCFPSNAGGPFRFVMFWILYATIFAPTLR
ncbi:Nucleolar protein 16, partial [Marasmius crinis-equi]